MKRKVSTLSFVIVFALMMSSVGWATAQTGSGNNRSQQEKRIRAVARDSTMAILTGDLPLLKSSMSRRSKEIWEVIYTELKSNTEFVDELKQAGVVDGDSFFDFGMNKVVSKIKGVPRNQIEEMVQATVDSAAIEFVNDKDVTLKVNGYNNRYVFENGDWKVDATDIAKKMAAQHLPLNTASKKRIESF